MSLQLAAQHIAHKGRGPDTTLVHMSRNEVKSLNDLAMAHGGQLTINPQTGLPEAGFLSAILPMVAGAALTGMSGGVINPMTAGFLVGGGSYLLNPKAGLMGALSAGLGAYGGAGLGQGLSSLATSEAGTTSANAMTQAAEEAEKKLIADNAARNAVIQQQTTDAAANAITPNATMPQAYQDFGAKTGFESASLPTPTGGVNVTTPLRELAPLDTQTVRDAAMESAYKSAPTGFDAMKQGFSSVMDDPSKLKQVGGGSWTGLAKMGLAAAAPAIAAPAKLNLPTTTAQKQQVVPHYRFTPGMVNPTPAAGATGTENTYFNPRYTAVSNEEAASLYPGYPAAAAANGGLMGYAGGGPIEQMSNNNAIGANTGFPQAYDHTQAYATPYQTPISQNVLTGSGDVSVDPYTGEQRMNRGGEAKSYKTTLDDSLETAYAKAQEANDTATMRAIEEEMEIRNTNKAGMEQGLSGMKGLATGGLSNARYNLGGYSDGGRLLRGPGDGVSDSIPAVIGKKQPARLADGEFVVPARIVSELGNGSTEAGARRLYAMMDRIQSARGKTVGKGKVAKNTRADKYLPA